MCVTVDNFIIKRCVGLLYHKINETVYACDTNDFYPLKLLFFHLSPNRETKFSLIYVILTDFLIHNNYNNQDFE